MRWLNTMGEYGLTWPHSVEENKDTCVEATTGSGDQVRHTTPTMPQIGTNISPKHSHTRTHLQIGHMSRTAQFTCPLLFDCGGMTIWERSTELHTPTINIERERPKRGERERERRVEKWRTFITLTSLITHCFWSDFLRTSKALPYAPSPSLRQVVYCDMDAIVDAILSTSWSTPK
jgi:hypothetical protein